MANDDDSTKTRQRGAEVGPTGRAVAQNLKRVREARGMDLRSLAAALREAGRYIAPSALSKIENNSRRVEVDELLALASVLNTSPLRLLLPAKDGDEMPTGLPQGITFEEVWAWARGETNLDPRALDAYWTGQAVKARDEIQQLEPQLRSEHAGMRRFAEMETEALNAKLAKAHVRMNDLAEVIEEMRDVD